MMRISSYLTDSISALRTKRDGRHFVHADTRRGRYCGPLVPQIDPRQGPNVNHVWL